MSETYDYILVGAGSAGCVLARRLSDDPDVEVLLLEAGLPATLTDIHEPWAYFNTFFTDWAWQDETEVERFLLSDRTNPSWGRRVFWPRGKTIGGTGSINGSMYVLGNYRVYDLWSRLGNEGWSFEEVLPFFKMSENGPNGSGCHGSEGPWPVRDIDPPNPISLVFLQAGLELGHPLVEDFTGVRDTGGVGLYLVNIVDRRRVSTATAFLDPVRTTRPNLTVRSLARARRVLFEGDRAAGVEYAIEIGSGRILETARARREVILCGGTVGSAQLLQLSGVGPADELRALGIPVRVDLPGVGENLQDHVAVLVGHLYAPGKHPEPPASGLAEGGLFLRTRPGMEDMAPDLQYFMMIWLMYDQAYVDQSIPPQAGFTMVPTAIQPRSRGTLRLGCADPDAAPRIQPNYLEAEADLETLVWGVRRAREILGARAFDAWRGAEVAPGPEVRTAAQVRDFVRLTATTLFHPVGTCKMGRDPLAVVDPELRVYGVTGLRVADASVMPVITAGNPNAPTVMIAEKAASMIRMET